LTERNEKVRILLLQLKRIGDAILTAPAVSALRFALPDARIELVLHGPTCQLAPMFHRVDKVWCYEQRRMNVRLWGSVVTGGYDAVLDFTGSDRSRLQSLLSRSGCRVAYDRDIPERGWGRHAATKRVGASVRNLSTVEYHLALVGGYLEGMGLAMPEAIPGPYLQVPQGVVLGALPSRYAVVHPGTARDEKFWPVERWVEVIDELVVGYSLPVVLTGSADEREQVYLSKLREYLSGLSAEVREVVTDMSGKLSLLETAAVIGGARVLLSVDSAAMHLGAQFAVPQIALFGPTNPFHWAPRHADARILLASAPRGAIEVDACLPRHEKAAMEAISVGSVEAVLAELLET